MSPLPLRVDYQSSRIEHFKWPCDDDWLIASKEGRYREATSLSPFEVREAFEAVKNAEGAASFLSECGMFWPFQDVLWSQFQEWQSFFKWLRLDPVAARKTPEGNRAWDTAQGVNSFFSQTDSEFSRGRYGGALAVAKIGPALWKKIESEDHQTLSSLRHFAIQPYREVEGLEGGEITSQITLQWHDPKDKRPPEDLKAPRIKGANGATLQPYLRIQALNIIEAVAATIYADRMDGLRYGMCKKCQGFFKIESDHVQQFCPPPRHLKSSPCKNAFTQHERRKNERAAIEFILKSWNARLNKTEIRKAAEADGIRLSPSIWAKAQNKRKK